MKETMGKVVAFVVFLILAGVAAAVNESMGTVGGILWGTAAGILLSLCVGDIIRDRNFRNKESEQRFRVGRCYKDLGFGTWDLICQGAESEFSLVFAIDHYAVLRNRDTNEKVIWVSQFAIPAAGVQIAEHDDFEVIPLERGFETSPR